MGDLSYGETSEEELAGEGVGKKLPRRMERACSCKRRSKAFSRSSALATLSSKVVAR